MFPYQEIEDEWDDYWLSNLLNIENKFVTYRRNNQLSFDQEEETAISHYYDLHIPSKQCQYIKIKNLGVDSDGHWRWQDLINNLNITWKIIQENEDKITGCVCSNPNINWGIVQKHPDKDWNYKWLSRNPNITWEIVQDNPDKPWNYYLLSQNPNITWEIVQANPDKPWDYYCLSLHPNITWEIVKANSDKDWHYPQLSKNLNITWDIVCKNPDKPWNYSRLSANPNITLEIVQANPDKNWDYYELSFNPNITFDYIDKNYKKEWSLYKFLNNEFPLEKDLFFKKKLREWFKKSDLKQELIAKLWHPKNYEKFKYYDPEMFSEDEGEEEE